MKPKVTLKQYQTIHRIVSSIGDVFSHGAGISCQFYNVNGAYILSKALKIKARPVMGAAFIWLKDGQDGMLTFAEIDNNGYTSTPNGFHCWIETDTHYIDFTAPEYSIALGQDVPQKMFQKQKSDMATSIDSFKNAGDFLFIKNESLTNHLLARMGASPASSDLAMICADWYKMHKKKNIQSMSVINDLGEVVSVNLKRCNLESSW
jgi:hypothetical protein